MSHVHGAVKVDHQVNVDVDVNLNETTLQPVIISVERH